MKVRNVAAAILVMCLGTTWSSLSWAQESSPSPTPEANERNMRELKRAVEVQKAAAKEAASAAAQAAKAARSEEIRIRKIFPAAFGLPRHLTQIQEAAERYVNSKDEHQKEQALQQLHDLTSQYFEEDMETRQKELQDIQARLQKLRSQLDRRRAKKDEIVELQVKVAINEAEGLGFTSAPRENVNFDFGAPAPMIIPREGPFDVLTTTLSSDIVPAPARIEVKVPTPPSPPLNELRLLGVGAKGDAVRLLQKVLNDNLDPSPSLNIDGDFGPETEKAVRAFQAEHDLEATGVVDEATREELDLPANLPEFIKN